MTCRDLTGLLPLFFDGELDPRQMREVALHSTRCDECEHTLREIERTQELVAHAISVRVDDLDLSQVWPAVAQRIATVRVPWSRRVRIWWEEREPIGVFAGRWRIPALAAALATIAIAVVMWSGSPTENPQIAEAPPVDNTAIIDSLDSSADNVAVLSEPETNTTVLWVNDDTDYGGEGFPP